MIFLLSWERVRLARKVGFEPDIVLIGGVALNVGFAEAIQRLLECKVFIPEDPEFVSAYGVALAALEE